MASQPETRQAQRIDQMEEAVADIRKTMSEEVANAVNKAAIELQQTLISQITSSLDQVTQKLQTRIDRVRETNETILADVHRQQDEFQAELRSTVLSLRQNQQNFFGETGVGGSNSAGRGSGFRGQNGGDTGFHGRSRTKDKDKLEDEFGHTGGNWRYRKLDLPIFDGTNPDGWLLRAERYFSFYRLSEEEKLEAAVVGFDGDALLWYQWENRRRPIRRWEEMRSLILQQFRPQHAGTLCEQWLAVK